MIMKTFSRSPSGNLVTAPPMSVCKTITSRGARSEWETKGEMCFRSSHRPPATCLMFYFSLPLTFVLNNNICIILFVFLFHFIWLSMLALLIRLPQSKDKRNQNLIVMTSFSAMIGSRISLNPENVEWFVCGERKCADKWKCAQSLTYDALRSFAFVARIQVLRRLSSFITRPSEKKTSSRGEANSEEQIASTQ